MNIFYALKKKNTTTWKLSFYTSVTTEAQELQKSQISGTHHLPMTRDNTNQTVTYIRQPITTTLGPQLRLET